MRDKRQSNDEKSESREKPCDKPLHPDMTDAINHAIANLGSGVTEPFWGTRAGDYANTGWVIGFQSADRQRRYRVDFDEKGLHVNEEDFTRSPKDQKVRHDIRHVADPIKAKTKDGASMERDATSAINRWAQAAALRKWKTWTMAFEKPAKVLEEEREIDRRR